VILENVQAYERAARRALPRSVFDVVAGGAGDETTLRRNRAAFESLALRPRALADVSERDLTTTVFGEELSMPLMLDPCGFARMAHREAELAVARAAAAAETIYVLSTVTSMPLEEVAASADGPKWFQLYPPADRGACAELIGRVRAAGFKALCVTIDGAVAGLRERDKRNRLSVPLKLSPRLALEGVRRPRWALDFVLGGAGRGSQGFGTLPRPQSMHEAGRAIAATARSILPEEIEFIRDQWDGPLLIKGVQRGDECAAIAELGANGVVVSNHGGRQLDTGLAAIEILPEVVEAGAGRLEVLVDGGFRRGTDIVKALALGARAVLVGRPYLYGLAVGGEAGVRDVLELLRFEIDQTIALLGCSRVDQLDASMIDQRHFRHRA
jgi:isopentenyl diphosphate isomerase/L-lactate dehydrogenase-like FMN-dependent dehydrogenase